MHRPLGAHTHRSKRLDKKFIPSLGERLLAQLLSSFITPGCSCPSWISKFILGRGHCVPPNPFTMLIKEAIREVLRED